MVQRDERYEENEGRVEPLAACRGAGPSAETEGERGREAIDYRVSDAVGRAPASQ
jgi:hypothetical protein